jgi:signal transduction histidine kinase
MGEFVSQDVLEYLLAAQADHPDTPEAPYTSSFIQVLINADRGKLSNSFTEHNFAAGEVVFHEGDQGDSMFLVWSGRVAIVKGDLTAPVILAYRIAGEIFGEMAVLENQPRSASIISLEETHLLELNRARFEQLLSEEPSIGRGIMEVLSARLRHMTAMRSTGELSEKRLSQRVTVLESEKLRLEELHRLRQETTELIIHDLRNPLSAIAISLKMMTLVLPEAILQANQELIDIAQISTQRMQRLVDSLLEVSRMETGEARFDMRSFNLGPLLHDVVQRNAILARKGVKIETEIDPHLPIIADREKIERVLVNLLDNALKYTPENGKIRVLAGSQGDNLYISVSDTGPGVPSEDRERIFERFTQGASDKLKRRGFGLGLAYCRLAVERHNGRIWVQDGPEGVGSRFIITLPAEQAPARQPEPAAKATEDSSH